MHPQDAAAYYTKQFGSAQAALDGLAGTWVDADDREVRQLLLTAAYNDKLAAAEASRIATVEKSALYLAVAA